MSDDNPDWEHVKLKAAHQRREAIASFVTNVWIVIGCCGLVLMFVLVFNNLAESCDQQCTGENQKGVYVKTLYDFYECVCVVKLE